MSVWRGGRGFVIGLVSFVLTAVAMIAAAPPAQAQFSSSYNFLKSVRDRNGEKATDALQAPGTTVVNTLDPATGESALHIVIKRRDATWTNFLLSRGANPNIRDGQGNTPLLAATQIGYAEGAEALIARRASVDLANQRGETPLILAVQQRNLELVRILLTAGANPRITDHVAGRSARDYAQQDPRAGAVLKLLDEVKPAGSRKVVGPSL